MKVHFLKVIKSATQYIQCGVKKTDNWTLNKLKVTCKDCLKGMDHHYKN